MIEQVVYTTIKGGLIDGAQCYEITINDTPSTLDEIITAIMKIQDHKAPGCKIVNLIGSFNPTQSDTIFGLLRTLTDAGYTIRATTDGKVYYPWMALVRMNVVITDGLWLGYKVQEFYWDADVEAKLILPPEPEKTNLFIMTGSVDRVIEIMKDSPLNWRHISYVDKSPPWVEL